jgi:transposase
MSDLRDMGRWLVEKGVRSVAMQSTGVYWMPVFEVLEQQGLEVYLLNAQPTSAAREWKADRKSANRVGRIHIERELRRDLQIPLCQVVRSFQQGPVPLVGKSD